MPGVNNVSLTASPDFSVEQQAIARQRQLAEMLQQQSMQPLDPNQMAGGYVIPVSPLAGLAKMLQAYGGQKKMAEADAKESDLLRRNQENLTSTYSDALKAAQGAPAYAPETTSENPWTGVDSDPARPAQAPNRDLAMAILSRNPQTAPIALQDMLAKLSPKAPIKVGKDDALLDPATLKPLYKPEQQPKFHVVSGNLVPEPSPAGGEVKPVFTAPDKPQKTVVDDVKAALVAAGVPVDGPEAKALFKSLAIKQTTHQPASSQTVINAGPKAFETELGKADAEKLSELRKAAEVANSTLATVQNMRGAVAQGVFEGGGAQAKTAVANLINGLTGAKIKALPGSQLFNAEASKLVLDHVKSLGANPSNADREFIEKTVPMLSTSPEARDQLIAFIEQKAAKQIDLYKRADVHARKNRGLGGFDFFGPKDSTNVDALLQKYGG